nr:immunoglobulin light chain junction region [Macaca mulatta]
CQQYDALPYSF